MSASAPAARRSEGAISGGLPGVVERLVESISERPPEDLDPDLDAAIRSFARRGIRHSSVPHIAQERGISRATLYKRIGSVDDIARLVLIRELHILVDSLPEGGARTVGPEGIIETAAAVVRHATGHPVFEKIMDDEPELFRNALRFAEPFIDVATGAVVPFIDAEMDAGRIRRAPAGAIARLLIDLMLAAIVMRPSDPEAHFAELLGPVLEP